MSESDINIVIHARDEASAVIQNVIGSMNSLGASGGTVSTTLVQDFKEIRSEVRLNQSAMRTLGTMFRQEHETFDLTGRLLSDIGFSARRAASMFLQYNVSMIRTEQATEAVREAQEKYNAAVESYGPTSSQATKASKNLTEAQEDAAQASASHAAVLGLVGLQAATLIGRLPTLRVEVLQVAASMQRNVEQAGGWIAALAAISGPLVGAIPVIGGFAYAMSDAGQTTGDTWSQMASQGQYLESFVYALKSAFDFFTVGLFHAQLGLEQYQVSAGRAAKSTMTAMDVWTKYHPPKIDPYVAYMDELSRVSNEAYNRYLDELEAATVEVSVEAKSTLTVDADITPAQTKVTWLEAFIAAIKALLGIGADTSEAESQANQLAANIGGMHPTITVGVAYSQDWAWAQFNPDLPYTPFPAYQHGTPFVPKTELALVHRGEEIRPATTNVTNTFSIGQMTGEVKDLEHLTRLFSRSITNLSKWRRRT